MGYTYDHRKPFGINFALQCTSPMVNEIEMEVGARHRLTGTGSSVLFQFETAREAQVAMTRAKRLDPRGVAILVDMGRQYPAGSVQAKVMAKVRAEQASGY